MKYQRRRKSKLGEMTFAVSRFVTLSLRDKIRAIVVVTLNEMSRKTDNPEESEVDTQKKKKKREEQRWAMQPIHGESWSRWWFPKATVRTW